MKLILKEYLASLKERGELDAILPDLLSQMGLNVIISPSRGVKEYGVDIAAVGSIGNGGESKVYLFSVKEGDLDRITWNGSAAQTLRPSLDEIQDGFIHSRIRPEDKDKHVVLCPCFGGDVRSGVRQEVTGYYEKNTKDNISFEEWNGDKLAEYIERYFLREDLAPSELRSDLRKSLAMIDQPEISFKHFSQLIEKLTLKIIPKKNKNTKEIEDTPKRDKDYLNSIRQLYLYLWILYAWCRNENNIESAYLSSERTTLYSWDMIKGYFDIKKPTKIQKDIQKVFHSILELYFNITEEYLEKKIIPCTGLLYGLSYAVKPSCSIDTNLRLFTVLGRLGVGGSWLIWRLNRESSEQKKETFNQKIKDYYTAIQKLIWNNPILLTPYKDEQAIEISLALQFLMSSKENLFFIHQWLGDMLQKIDNFFLLHRKYPSTISNYAELLTHPKEQTKEYRQEVTQASILFPYISIFAALLNLDDICDYIKDMKIKDIKVKGVKEKLLSHSNFQVFLLGDDSEEHFYKNTQNHGIAFCQIPVEIDLESFLKCLNDECIKSNQYQEMSIIRNDFIPILLIGCQHYHLPITLHYILALQ